MSKVLAAAVTALSLVACTMSAPVVMLAPGGQVLRGTTTTETLSGSDFNVSDANLTCTGHFDPAIMSKIVVINASCSDGRTGVGQAVRDGRLSGSGSIQMNDGGNASIAYGNAAAGI